MRRQVHVHTAEYHRTTPAVVEAARILLWKTSLTSCGESNSLIEEEEELPHRFNSKLVAVEADMHDHPQTNQKGYFLESSLLVVEKKRICSKQLCKAKTRTLLQQQESRPKTNKKRISPLSRQTVKEIFEILSTFSWINGRFVVDDACNGNTVSSAKGGYSEQAHKTCMSVIEKENTSVSSTTEQTNLKCSKGTNDHRLPRWMAQQLSRLKNAYGTFYQKTILMALTRKTWMFTFDLACRIKSYAGTKRLYTVTWINIYCTIHRFSFILDRRDTLTCEFVIGKRHPKGDDRCL